jgi:hypothetical protein
MSTRRESFLLGMSAMLALVLVYHISHYLPDLAGWRTPVVRAAAAAESPASAAGFRCVEDGDGGCRILAPGGAPALALGDARPLGWAPDSDILLLQTGGPRGRYMLLDFSAWDGSTLSVGRALIDRPAGAASFAADGRALLLQTPGGTERLELSALLPGGDAVAWRP